MEHVCTVLNAGQRRSEVTGSRFAALLSPRVWLFPTTHQLALESGRSRCSLDRATMVASCWPNTLPDYQSSIRLHGRQLSCIMWQTRRTLHTRQIRRITACNCAAPIFLRDVSAFRDVNKCIVGCYIGNLPWVSVQCSSVWTVWMRETRLFRGQIIDRLHLYINTAISRNLFARCRKRVYYKLSRFQIAC